MKPAIEAVILERLRLAVLTPTPLIETSRGVRIGWKVGTAVNGGETVDVHLELVAEHDPVGKRQHTIARRVLVADDGDGRHRRFENTAAPVLISEYPRERLSRAEAKKQLRSALTAIRNPFFADLDLVAPLFADDLIDGVR